MNQLEENLCKCGCGSPISLGRHFVSGHNTKFELLTGKRDYSYNHGFANSTSLEKYKDTMRKRYGVEYAAQRDFDRTRMRTENPMKKEVVKTTREHFNLVKYGVKHHWSSPEVREKMKQTCLRKFGVSNAGVLVRGKSNTNIEKLLKSSLRDKGMDNFKVNVFVICCHPDILFNEKKLAIFCDGDFWHANPDVFTDRELKNSPFGDLTKNRLKDIRQKETLEQNGWKVLRFWENEIRNDLDICIKKIIETLSTIKEGGM